MKVLLVGSGTAASRIYDTIVCLHPTSDILVATSNPLNNNKPSIFSLDERVLSSFDFFFLCGASVTRACELRLLIPFGKPIFSEKPLIAPHEAPSTIKELQEKCLPNTLYAVGYCLHFIPEIKKTILAIKSQGCIELTIVCKSNVLKWPNRSNPSLSLSHSSALGGGVVSELSHEIDILHSIFDNIQWLDLRSATLHQADTVPGEIQARASGSSVDNNQHTKISLSLSLNHRGPTKRSINARTVNGSTIDLRLDTKGNLEKSMYSTEDIHRSYRTQVEAFFRYAYTPSDYPGRQLAHMYDVQNSIYHLHQGAIQCSR